MSTSRFTRACRKITWLAVLVTFTAEKMRSIVVFVLFLALSKSVLSAKGPKGEDDDDDAAPNGFREPKPCEVCKYLAVELQARLDETGKVRGFIETGHGLDPVKKKKKEYKKSELRLIEAVHEPPVCDRLLEYNVHAERKKSLRYAKGRSETMETLHGLVNKGVKVELGMPYELWDKPSAEVTQMQRICFAMVEEYEDDIEEWYYGSQEKPLVEYLCRDRILKGKDTKCLDEKHVLKGSDGAGNNSGDTKSTESKQKEKPAGKAKRKGDAGIPSTSMPPVEDSNDDISPIPPPATEAEIKDEL